MATTTTLLSPSCIIILLLSLSLFPFIIHGHKHKHKHYTLIQKTCRKITEAQHTDYALCVSALQARPAQQCATLRRIGWTCIELIISNVTDTRRHIHAALKGGKVKRPLRRCVRDCYEVYGDARLRAEEALRYYRHKKYFYASIGLSGVIAYATDCEDLFALGTPDRPSDGCGGGFSPFSARNNVTAQLSAMAEYVIDLIEEEEGKVLH